MAKKKATKKAAAKKSTDQLRTDAIKDIDERLNGDATPADKDGTAKGKASAKKAASTKVKNSKKDKKPRQPSGLDAATQVLAASKEPMRCKDIVDKMLSQGLWSTKGKTPHATIYAAIIREIQSKGVASRFEKVDRGRFQIRQEA